MTGTGFEALDLIKADVAKSQARRSQVSTFIDQITKANGVTPAGASAPMVIGTAGANDRSVGGQIVKYAEKFLGTPYAYGGNNLKKGIDCSGLVQQVYKKFGFSMPRVSNQQAATGKRVNIKNLRPGDLVAWDNSSRNVGADHIAIYAGNGQIIEAPRTGLNVRIRPLSSNEGAWGVRVNAF